MSFINALIDMFTNLFGAKSDSSNSEPTPIEPEPVKPAPQYQENYNYKKSLKTIATLCADLQPLATQFLDTCFDRGTEILIYYGFRTREEQEKLYAQGRTAPGKIVTNAKPGTSRHELGEAFDFAPIKNGKIDWESDLWDELGQIVRDTGLVWGGDFKSLRDRPHAQLPSK